MEGIVPLQRAALFNLVDALTPHPDDPGDPDNPLGPYGPIGPVIRRILGELDYVLLNPQPLPPRIARRLHELRNDIDLVLLNPQPLPPREGPLPDPWRFTTDVIGRLGPHPQPWRVGTAARHAIAAMIARFRQAEFADHGEQSERSFTAFRAELRDLVDDWCGNRPPRWPWPWPPRRDRRELYGEELLVAGAQFSRIAEAMADNPLRDDFAAAATQFLETGLKRLDEAHAPSHATREASV
jgi:hypothetical protein